jgi:hypothetical protein
MAEEPSGFAYEVRKSGDVLVTHHGRQAAVLRGRAAERFLADVGRRDPQQVMARVTGNYRHGNERQGRSHPRNQRR